MLAALATGIFDLALGCALHRPVQPFRPIGRYGVFLAAGFGGSDDLCLGQPQFVTPALDVQPRRPALPPAGQSDGVEAQRCQQLPENLIGNRLARLRALLLLYWFT